VVMDLLVDRQISVSVRSSKEDLLQRPQHRQGFSALMNVDMMM